MATHFKRETVTIPLGTGRRSIRGSVEFPATVRRADVVLNGFRLDFGGASAVQRPIGVIEADVDIVSVSGRTVVYKVECEYADKNFDDRYSGWITAAVIADVA